MYTNIYVRKCIQNTVTEVKADLKELNISKLWAPGELHPKILQEWKNEVAGQIASIVR